MAVSALFVANAVAPAAVVPRLAEIQASLGMTDAGLGLVLAVGALGGVIVGPVAGPLAARVGTARLAVVSLLLLVPVLPVIGLASQAWVLALLLCWVGATDAVMDAAQNAHALRVQSIYGRSIINAFHGFWSLGAVLGAALGAASLVLGVPLGWFLLGISLLTTALVLGTAGGLLRDPDPPRNPERAGGGRRIFGLAVVLLGSFTLLAVMVEDIPSRWSSVYLTSIEAPLQLVGVGFVVFAAFQTLGRFTADRMVDRFGDVAVVRAGMAVSAVVLSIGLARGTAWAFIAACAVVGFGVASLFPAAMHAATALPGTSPATGIAIVAWLARIGFIAAPLAVGAVAEATSVALGVGLAAVAAALLVPFAVALRR